MSNPIVGVAIKDSRYSHTGITFYDQNGDVHIREIMPSGLFYTTDLRTGMKLTSINNIPIAGMNADMASKMVADAEGTLTILATDPSAFAPSASFAPSAPSLFVPGAPSAPSATSAPFVPGVPNIPPVPAGHAANYQGGEADIDLTDSSWTNASAPPKPMYGGMSVPPSNVGIPVAVPTPIPQPVAAVQHVAAVQAKPQYQASIVAPVKASSNPPPGVADGGEWGIIHMLGYMKTKTVYRYNGKFYTKKGKFLSSDGKYKFEKRRY